MTQRYHLEVSVDMGMDYKYAGSASYDRFGNEVEIVAKLFGGVLTEEYVKHQKSIIEGTVDWWMGDHKKFTGRKFTFPDGVDSTFVEWVEHPYKEFTSNETEKIYSILATKSNDIPIQILSEFTSLVVYGEGWYIN